MNNFTSINVIKKTSCDGIIVYKHTTCKRLVALTSRRETWRLKTNFSRGQVHQQRIKKKQLMINEQHPRECLESPLETFVDARSEIRVMYKTIWMNRTYRTRARVVSFFLLSLFLSFAPSTSGADTISHAYRRLLIAIPTQLIDISRITVCFSTQHYWHSFARDFSEITRWNREKHRERSRAANSAPGAP